MSESAPLPIDATTVVVVVPYPWTHPTVDVAARHRYRLESCIGIDVMGSPCQIIPFRTARPEPIPRGVRGLRSWSCPSVEDSFAMSG